MSLPSLIARGGRLFGLLALCATALLAGCAQAPTQRASQNSDFSTQQGREIFAATFANAVQQDEFYEDTLKIPRNLASFGAFKSSMSALYTDPLVLDWLYTQFERGRKRDEIFRDLGTRFFNGVMRLNDAQSMQLLNAMGEMTGRLTPEQCELFQKPSEKDPKGENPMAKMLAWMTPDETRRFFGGLHQSLRADLTNAPQRPAPSREQLGVMFAALGKEVPGGLFKSSGNGCRDLNRIVSAVNRLEGPVRSHAITYLLYTMGLAGRSAARGVA